MIDYRAEFERAAPGLEVNRYYDAWRLLVMLWRDMWWNSATDWSRYRLDIWSKFTERVQSAARTSGDLDGFLSRAARLLNLNGVGGNEDDRVELMRALALTEDERRRVMRLLRDDTAILVALVRRWRDAGKENKAATQGEMTWLQS